MIAAVSIDAQHRRVGDGGPPVDVIVNGKRYSKVLAANAREGYIRIDAGHSKRTGRRQTRTVHGTVVITPIPRGS